MSEQVPKLSKSDELYLLLAKWDLAYLFNQLCYAYDVWSIQDLKTLQQNGWCANERLEGSLDHLDTDAKFQLERLIEAADGGRTTDFDELYYYQGRMLKNYEDELKAGGVPTIKREDLCIKSIIARNCPCSGDIYLAEWTRPDKSKIAVCLHCDIDSEQRALFLKEAKMLMKMRHPNIVDLFGAVTLGCCVQSLALVVEYAPFGNIEEHHVESIRSAWLYSVQVASALAYLEERQFVHGALMEPFILVFSTEKVKIKGLAYCYTHKEIEKAMRSKEYLETLLHFQDGLPVPFTPKTVVNTFGEISKHMFQMPPKTLPVWRQLSQERQVYSGSDPKPLLCPKNILAVLKRCMTEDPDDRPTFNEIEVELAKEKPVKVRTIKEYQKDGLHEMSYSVGEEITVISQSPQSYNGLWFGQKVHGMIGYFHPSHTVPAEDDSVPPEIRARGPEARHAYRMALLEGKVQVRRARLMLIGQDRAGKTSLKKSLLGLPFDPQEQSTDGVEVDASTLEIEVNQVKNTSWNPVCEPERVEGRLDKEVARLVAERLSKGSHVLDEVREPELPRNANGGTEVIPNASAQETTHTGKHSADEQHRNDSAETESDQTDGRNERKGQSSSKSTKTREKVPEEVASLVTDLLKDSSSMKESESKEILIDVWDFAGQHLYYASHPFFFTQRAIYLLVHNLSKDLHSRAEPCVKQGTHELKLDNQTNETNLDTLLSWLVSVHSIRKGSVDLDENEATISVDSPSYERPPVILVGTHADKIPPHDVKKSHAIIAKKLDGKAYGNHVIAEFFAVDNKQGRGVDSLQTKVEQVLRCEPYIKVALPVKWFKFEEAVKTKEEKSKVHYMRLDKVQQFARSECFIRDDKQVEAMLNFFHDLGVIVRHRNTVVLQSQWLINLFKKLITVRPFHDQAPKYRKCWQILEKTGILHEELIGHAFQELTTEENDTKEDLLAMMEEYGLIAKFSVTQNGVQDAASYFVPAQLTSSPASLSEMKPREGDPCFLFVHFLDGFVPHGLFPQLVSRLIQWCPKLGCTQQPNLYCNAVRCIVGSAGQFDLTLCCGQRFIKVMLRTSIPESSGHVKSATMTSIPIRVRTFLEETLVDMKQEYRWLGSVKYEVSVSCGACEKSCEQHGGPSCRDVDCLHFVPVINGSCLSQQFVCSERFGDDARFTLPGLTPWYLVEIPKERAIKTGPPSRDDLMCLARDVGPGWKRVGRALQLDDRDLDQIEADESCLYERCYGMLRKWTQVKASGATYESLGRALQHVTVLRSDLAVEYCWS